MNVSKLNLKDFATGNIVEVNSFLAKPQTITSFKFFAEKEVVEEKEFTKAQHEADLQKVKQSAFEEGYKKGKSELDNYVSSEDIKIKEQVSALLSRLLESMNSFKVEQENFKLQIAKMVSHMTKKICAEKLKENADEIIISAISKVSDLFKKEPEIAFKCNQELLTKIQPTIESFFEKNLPTTKPIFLPVTNLDSIEVAIEWEKSGINISLNERLSAVDEIFNEFIKSL